MSYINIGQSVERGKVAAGGRARWVDVSAFEVGCCFRESWDWQAHNIQQASKRRTKVRFIKILTVYVVHLPVLEAGKLFAICDSEV
ncbi:hypothetical protein IH992_21520 [Candidatus Poribacteria bacterium]|nr:hypothetical protein [Candidatus Poribacteria bacterium]